MLLWPDNMSRLPVYRGVVLVVLFDVAPLLASPVAGKSDKWGVTRMDETAHPLLSNILNTQSARARRRNSDSHEPSKVRSRSTVDPSKVR